MSQRAKKRAGRRAKKRARRDTEASSSNSVRARDPRAGPASDDSAKVSSPSSGGPQDGRGKSSNAPQWLQRDTASETNPRDSPDAAPRDRDPAGREPPDTNLKLGRADEASQQTDTQATSQSDGSKAPKARAKTGERKRIPRMTRLTPAVNAMLEELAAFRGIDLNATISVAIGEDHRRVFANRDR